MRKLNREGSGLECSEEPYMVRPAASEENKKIGLLFAKAVRRPRPLYRANCGAPTCLIDGSTATGSRGGTNAACLAEPAGGRMAPCRLCRGMRVRNVRIARRVWTAGGAGGTWASHPCPSPGGI